MCDSIFVLFIPDVAAALVAGQWGKVWIWAATFLLVFMFAAMIIAAIGYAGLVLILWLVAIF